VAEPLIQGTVLVPDLLLIECGMRSGEASCAATWLLRSPNAF
jgi:hypothetical protein